MAFSTFQIYSSPSNLKIKNNNKQTYDMTRVMKLEDVVGRSAQFEVREKG